MDVNDDLCRADFFDFVKLENGPNGLTPVAFIDSLDYAQTDGNNNLSTTGGQIKTILDEMLLSDPLCASSDILHTSQSNLELLGSIPWTTSNSHLDSSLTPTGNGSSDPSPSWLLHSGAPSEGEITTLTNLLDPLFVSYDDQKMDQYFASTPPSSSDPSSTGVISSDLVTTTFMNGSSTSPPNDSELLSWQKSSDPFCDESLLRSALQAGHNGGKIVVGQTLIPTPVMSVSQKSQPTPGSGSSGMTELRKVLSFPPLANGNHPNGEVTLSSIASSNSPLVSNGSPTSSEEIMGGSDHFLHHHSTNGSIIGRLGTDLGVGDGRYYELKVLDSVFADSDSVIPNVDDLITTRITPQFDGTPTTIIRANGIKKGIEISEKKINSTTLSAKWTYTTTNDQNKTPRKRNKKNGFKSGSPIASGELSSSMTCDNQRTIGGGTNSSSPSTGSPKSSQNSPSNNNNASSTGNMSGSGTSRKERSLHYCTICCKGFKDKYSVNVHVRTHTGEKPFSCTLCGKNFRQKAHLAKHYQTHAAKANNPHGKGSKRSIINLTPS